MIENESVFVFFDTNIIIGNKYDFNNEYFIALKKYCNMGVIKLLTHRIVFEEVKSNASREIELSAAQLRNFVKQLECLSEIFKMAQYSLLTRDFRKEGWGDIFNSKWDEFLKETNCILLGTESVNIDEIMSDYFAQIAPFEDKENKKHEFPDAIIIKSIKAFVQEEKLQLKVVTSDKGWLNALGNNDSIEIHSTLKSVLDQISKNVDNIMASRISGFIEHSSGEIKEKIIQLLNEDSYTFTDEANYEIDEIINTIIEISTDTISINYISEEGSSVNINCRAGVSIQCSYDDYESAIYDSEEDEYIFLPVCVVKEKHNFEFECTLDLDHTLGNFEINDIEISDDIYLDSLTLQERELITDGMEGFGENNEHICPDCGCILTVDNNTFTGFCSKCSENH